MNKTCPDDIHGSTIHYLTCTHPAHNKTDRAIDWLMAVRKFGLDKANEMFPEGLEND